MEFTYTSGIISVSSNLEDVDKYYVYAKNSNGNYEKITSSSSKTIDLTELVEGRRKGLSLPELSDLKIVAYSFGEIRNMFLAIQAICKDNSISADNIVSSLSSISDSDMYIILNSIIVSETIITQIEEPVVYPLNTPLTIL